MSETVHGRTKVDQVDSYSEIVGNICCEYHRMVQAYMMIQTAREMILAFPKLSIAERALVDAIGPASRSEDPSVSTLLADACPYAGDDDLVYSMNVELTSNRRIGEGEPETTINERELLKSLAETFPGSRERELVRAVAETFPSSFTQ